MSCCPSCAGGGGSCTAPETSIVGFEIYGPPDQAALDRANRERGAGFFGTTPRKRRAPAGYVAPPSRVDTSQGGMTPEEARRRRAAADQGAAPALPGPRAPVELRLPPVAFAQAFRSTARGAVRAVAPLFRQPPPELLRPVDDGSGVELDVGALVAAAEAGDELALGFLAQLLADEEADAQALVAGVELPREVRQVDDVLSSIWEGVREVVPYGQQIDALHRARRAAMYGPEEGARDERGAARGRAARGGPRQDTRTRAQLDAPGRVITPRTPGGGVRVQAPTVPSAAVASLQQLVRDASRGAPDARAELVRLKEGAAAGDVAARRRWAAAVSVMRDDDSRIERSYRAKVAT